MLHTTLVCECQHGRRQLFWWPGDVSPPGMFKHIEETGKKLGLQLRIVETVKHTIDPDNLFNFDD